MDATDQLLCQPYFVENVVKIGKADVSIKNSLKSEKEENEKDIVLKRQRRALQVYFKLILRIFLETQAVKLMT